MTLLGGIKALGVKCETDGDLCIGGTYRYSGKIQSLFLESGIASLPVNDKERTGCKRNGQTIQRICCRYGKIASRNGQPCRSVLDHGSC